MFKSKVDFNAFDLNNKKVKNLELTKVKNLSKGNVTQLLAKPNEKTPFHLILDYFKGADGKPLEHFIGFGNNKKLDKHFMQVEMKPGKVDQSMSNSPKEATMGFAYAKEQDGKVVLCLEPSPQCKVPKGKWNKIIKKLKPFLSGATVVLVSGEEKEDKKASPNPVVDKKIGRVKSGIARIEEALKGKNADSKKITAAITKLVTTLKEQQPNATGSQVGEIDTLLDRLDKMAPEKMAQLTPETRQKVKLQLKGFETEVASILSELQV